MTRDTALLRLQPADVHVWHAATSEAPPADLLDRCRAILSSDELKRAARFVFDRDRNMFLAAHALVRTRLSAASGVDPIDWVFETNAYGRPEISAPAEFRHLRFNLSHTRGMVACALALERDIGVDVEDVERMNATVDIARRFFAESEVAALALVPEEDRRREFFDYWTLKESYIKARGMGLALPLGQFAFRLGDERAIGIEFGPEIADDPAMWEFHHWRPTARHRLALAIHRAPDEKMNVVVRATSPCADD